MGINKKVSLLAFFLVVPIFLIAQFNNNTSSPYSRFGLGDLQSYSFGRTTAMGGASLASRHRQQINLSNPASYTAVDSLVFMFEFGVRGKFSQFANDAGSINVNDINFNYFALNFQFTNWLATSMGLTPYSDVGYQLEMTNAVENAGNVYNKYYGEGSLSRAFWGFAIQPVKNISVGADFNYLFGKLNRNAETLFLGSASFYNNQKFESLRLRDFNVGLGIQGTIPLKENRSVTVAAVWEQPSYTGFYSEIRNSYISIPTGGSNSITDSKQDTVSFQDRVSVGFPLTLGAGISYVKEDVLEINADYYHQGWSDVQLPGGNNDVLTNLDKFALGAEWIPDRFSIRSYLKRVAYRAGVKYENSYLVFDNQQINDFGISFGVGLPVYRSNSTINISAEMGRRGTKTNNLVLENYVRLNLSVNLYDFWFIQRRYE